MTRADSTALPDAARQAAWRRLWEILLADAPVVHAEQLPDCNHSITDLDVEQTS